MRLDTNQVRFGFLALLIAALQPAVALAAQGSPASPAAQPQAEEAASRSTAAHALTLRGIEVAKTPDGGDRVVLKLDGPPRYVMSEVEDPYRIVIDLDETIARLAHNVQTVSSSALQRVRGGQYRLEPSPVARVVLDMNGRRDVQARVEGKTVVIDVAASASPQAETASAEEAAPRPADTPTAFEPAHSASGAYDEAARHGVSSSELAPQAAPGEMDAAAIDTHGATPSEATRPEAAPTVEATNTKLLVGSLPAGPKVKELPARDSQGAVAGPAATWAPPQPTAARASSVAPIVYEPASALEAQDTTVISTAQFEKKTIAGEQANYTGKKISLNLVDADIKQVFRLFHEISALNFVLDPSVTGRVTIVVDEVPWDQALDLILRNNSLDKVYEGNVVRIATTQKLAQEAGARKAFKDAKELEADTVTITRTLSYAKAKDVDQVIKTGVLLSARGKSFYDNRTNTIIITDVPTKIEPIDRLLTSLDEKTTQVVIEARIVETSREFIQDLGIRWGFSGERSDALGQPFKWDFPHNASVNWDLNLARNPGVSQLGFSFANIKDSFTLDIALDALETEGKGRILSAPKVQTQNNVAAEIEQGIRIPIVNTTATEINVDFVSASLRLKVIPQITKEGTVSLDLEVENNSPDFVNKSGNQPSIRTQRAQTTVLVSDGGTTVIGGIFTINEGSSVTGVPFFRKIPLFGWLFKSRNVTSENRELLVFVTPKIIKG